MQTKNEMNIYKTVLDLLDVGVHAIDKSGKTILYNKKMMEVEGTEVEDVLDKNILEVFQFYQGEDSTLLKVLKTGAPIYNTQQKYFNYKGYEIKTVNNTFPLLHNNQIIGAVEIVRDVTHLEKMIKNNSQRKPLSSHSFDFYLDTSIFPKKVLETGKKVAVNSSSIFIIGEKGTGKHILTECIHQEVNQLKRPYIVHNCTSFLGEYVEKEIIESIKHLEKTDGGTLVIEDIQNLSPIVQLNLLALLSKERKYKIICTVNEDPIDLIAKGKLNKKFYYLLGELTIFIPPLRERKQAIQSIITFFIKKYNELFQKNVQKISEEVNQHLMAYEWPGNIRELEKMIKNSMEILENEETLQFHHLPTNERNRISQNHPLLMNKNQEMKPFEEYIQEAEKYYIQKGLQYHQYNITKTAQALNMSRQNLQYRMRKYGIKKNPQ